MAKDTFYFSHDYNSRNDEKIKSLIFKHGLRGYGIFWAIIEDLYNNANELQTNYERIAFELREDVIIVKSVIEDFELFVINDNYFGSNSVKKRLEDRALKSKKATDSVSKRWEKQRLKELEDTNVLPPNYDSNTIKESKGEEIKEKKEEDSIVYINPEFLKFNDWLKENAPNVLKLKEPISEAQYLKLKEYDRTIIKETLISMHNFKNLTKNYVSAYITLTNWIKRNNKNKNNQENEQSRIAKNIAVAKQYIEQSRDNGV